MEKMTVLPFLESLSNKTTNDQSQSLHLIYIKIDKNRLYIFEVSDSYSKKKSGNMSRLAIFCGFKYKFNSSVTGSH